MAHNQDRALFVLEETRQPRFLPAIQTVDPGFLRGISRGISGEYIQWIVQSSDAVHSPPVSSHDCWFCRDVEFTECWYSEVSLIEKSSNPADLSDIAAYYSMSRAHPWRKAGTSHDPVQSVSQRDRGGSRCLSRRRLRYIRLRYRRRRAGREFLTEAKHGVRFSVR